MPFQDCTAVYPRSSPHVERRADPIKRLDTNQNGLLEEREAQAAGRQLFGSIDENRDGRLQPEEIKGRLGGPVQKAADTDADGAVRLRGLRRAINRPLQKRQRQWGWFSRPERTQLAHRTAPACDDGEIARQLRGCGERNQTEWQTLRAWLWRWRPRHPVGRALGLIAQWYRRASLLWRPGRQPLLRPHLPGVTALSARPVDRSVCADDVSEAQASGA